MSASFLAAVAQRLADARVRLTPELSVDTLLLVLVHLDLPSRLRAAVVNTSFLEASRRPELYTVVGKSVLSRRTSWDVLRQFAELLLGPNTRELDLANMRVLNEEAEELHYERMRNVLLRGGPQRECCESGHMVLRDVPRMPNLESLDLSATELTDDVLYTVATQHAASLKRIYLWATEGISDHGIGCLAHPDTLVDVALEVVDLRMCGSVTGAGVRALVSGCPRLTDLRLKGLAGIDDRTFLELGANCQLLTSLDASVGSSGLGARKQPGVTDRGVKSLACKHPYGCPKLEQLLLSGNSRVTDAGVAALAERCTGLRLLDLQGCSTCGDGAALALAAHCHSLEVVSFQCCARLSDDGFVALCTRCPRLRHLTIKLCKVTQAAIDEMRAAHPSLVIVDHGPWRETQQRLEQAKV